MELIREYLESEGYKLRDLGNGFWTTTAIFRGGTKPTSLNISQRNGWFHDWVSGAQGSLKDLMALISGGEVSDEKLNELLSKIDNYEAPPEKIKVTKKFNKEILLTLLPDYRFFARRFISEDTQKLFQVGLCSSGKLRNRYVVPWFNYKTGDLAGMTGRHYKDIPPEGVPKWKHEGRTAEALFPIHLNDSIIREKKEIILLESPGDCLALWEMGRKNTIVCFGTRASSKVINYISGIYGLQKIWIAFNDDTGINDELAGNCAAEKLKKKLSKLFNPEKIEIVFPSGSKDWSEYWVKKNS